MKFSIASYLDIYIGRPLIKVVSLLPPVPKLIGRNLIIENVLIMKFWGFGSIFEATPLFRNLKDQYPEASIDLLTFSENRQISNSLNLFDTVHVIDLHKGLLSLLRQTVSFILGYRRKYSMIIDLEFFAMYSAFLTKMLGSTYSLGFDSFWASRNRCYSKTVVFDHSNHIRHIFLKFIDALGTYPANDVSLSSPEVPEGIKQSTLEKLPSLKNSLTKIAININTSQLSYNRRWPLQKFRELISLLQRDHPDTEIYLVGSGSDAEFVASFFQSLSGQKGIINASGMLDILEFTYALTRMNLLVTSDSGPLHIAEAVGTPVVCFFGPETHRLYGPLSRNSLVFSRNIYCSPCINTYNHKRTNCRDNQCLKLIQVQDVYDALNSSYLRRTESVQTVHD